MAKEQRADLPILLLPGMDGTGRLFRPFRRELPESITTHIASFPVDRPARLRRCSTKYGR